MPLLLIPLVLIIFSLVCAMLHLHRQAGASEERYRRAREEKEAVIALMDSIGERMTQGIGLKETLEVIAQYIVKATRAQSGVIYLLDETDNLLQAHVVIGDFPPLFESEEIRDGRLRELPEMIRRHRVNPEGGIIGSALREDGPLLLTDAEADPRIPRAVAEAGLVHNLILCPMRVRGKKFGLLAVANKGEGGVFDSRDRLLMQALADQAAVTVDLVRLHSVLARQQRLDQEIEVARGFQTMLIPRECPVIEGCEFSGISLPAQRVGGDFYDFIQLDAEHVGIAIADVSGKGIPAAIIMAMARSDLRAAARGSLSPFEVLARVNDRVREDTKDDIFVTMIYAILNTRTWRLKLVRAGHEPALIVRGGAAPSVEALMPEGMGLGLMPPEIFANAEEIEIGLNPGDTLLLYTDGVTEARDGKGKEFGRDRLIKFLGENHTSTAAALIAGIRSRVGQYEQGAAQQDDVTMVALQIHPAGTRQKP